MGPDRPAFSLQAGDDQHVRQHPDAGEDRSAPHAVPAFTVVIDRIVTRLLSFFGPAQQEIGVHGTEGRRGAGVGPGMDTHRNASQPVLRVPEAADSKSRQLNAGSSLAPQGLGPTLWMQASEFTGSPTAARSSDPCTTKAALDKAYRRELTAWVATAEPNNRAAHQEVEKKINAYLEGAEEQGWAINLSNLYILTLPPLPADLKALDVSGTSLIALPENLPQGLQTLVVRSTRLSALPKNLPQGLLTLNVSYTKLRALPANLPQRLQTLDVSCTELIALPANLPQNLLTLNLSYTKLSALPANLPQNLLMLNVRRTKLIALPERLPQRLQTLDVSCTELIALPAKLPQDLRRLDVSDTKLIALPEKLPQDLLTLNVSYTEVSVLPKNLPQGLLTRKRVVIPS